MLRLLLATQNHFRRRALNWPRTFQLRTSPTPPAYATSLTHSLNALHAVNINAQSVVSSFAGEAQTLRRTPEKLFQHPHPARFMNEDRSMSLSSRQSPDDKSTEKQSGTGPKSLTSSETKQRADSLDASFDKQKRLLSSSVGSKNVTGESGSRNDKIRNWVVQRYRRSPCGLVKSTIRSERGLLRSHPALQAHLGGERFCGGLR